MQPFWRMAHWVRMTNRRLLATLTSVLLTSILLTTIMTTSAAGADVGTSVGFATTSDGLGHWSVTPVGVVTAAGSAVHHGDLRGRNLNRPVVGLARTTTGRGYWLVAGDGGIFSFGDAQFYGSTGAITLNKPIVGMTATPSGSGYWFVASDGGIFSFGDARFYGSTGTATLNQPIVGMAGTATGNGYWMVATDGGIFSFGDARFYGSTTADPARPTIVAMVVDSNSLGYWLVSDGGSVFSFGEAIFHGSASDLGAHIVGADRAPGGYAVITAGGAVRSYTAGVIPPPATSTDSQTPASTPSGFDKAMTDDLFTRLNAERAERGLPRLSWDPALATLADEWSATMAHTKRFEHRQLSAVFLRPEFSELGYVAENIAYAVGYQNTATTLHVGWMKSDAHRQNMLQPAWSKVGISVVCADGVAWATQNFGFYRPTTAAAITTTMPAATPIVATVNDTLTCPSA